MKYDDGNNKIIAELHNLSDNDYEITASGNEANFIELYLKCDSAEIPSTSRPILSNISFSKSDVIKSELSLDDIGFSDSCEAYAKASFYIVNPDKILWCGEFGTIRHANIKWRENWMRDVITVLRENGIPYCLA